MKTVYQLADEAMREEISRYLEIAKVTNGFTNINESHLSTFEKRRMFATGIGLHIGSINDDPGVDILITEWNRKRAIPFDIERSVTVGVYASIRPFAAELFDKAKELTKDFTEYNADKLFENPYLLPIFQHLSGVFSKAELKKIVGSVSDTGFSKPASERLSELLATRVDPENIDRNNILQRMESTLEGIVRDLVGRVLFEEVVAEALKEESVPFLREEEYSSLSGVVYNFRSDFVIPNEKNPIAFIEVRKSSSRHASLYAKDKMFSAINWKGKHKNLIGIIVVEGDWTKATLDCMANVFDYVIPLHQSPFMAATLKRAYDGDESVLKWLIDFSISENPKYSK